MGDVWDHDEHVSTWLQLPKETDIFAPEESSLPSNDDEGFEYMQDEVVLGEDQSVAPVEGQSCPEFLRTKNIETHKSYSKHRQHPIPCRFSPRVR